MKRLYALIVAAALCFPSIGAWAWWQSIQQVAVVTGGAFTPASLPGLIGWYKADAGVFSDAGITPATNGGTVQQWNDLSGLNNHLLQATAGSRPTYTTGALNALPVISNATSKFMATNSSFALGGTTVSVFIVVQATATTAGRVIEFAPGADTNTDSWLVFFPSLTTVQSYASGALSSGTVSSGTWNEAGAIWDGANNTTYINGTAQTPAASTQAFGATGFLRIFIDNSGTNNPMAGNIAEIIVTSGALGSTDRASIHTYFLSKWGV